MIIAAMSVPGMLSRPPMTTIGKILSPTSATPKPPPATATQSTPAIAEIAPVRPHTTANSRLRSIPAPAPRRAREQGADHDPLAGREIDHARRLVDQHERERDQRIDRAGKRALDHQRQKEDERGRHGAVTLHHGVG